MIVDKRYCMSSYLMLRTVADENKAFAENWKPNLYSTEVEKFPVQNSAELKEVIQKYMEGWTKGGKAALALSGGIDSAILAKFMPEGSKVYTFQCIVPGREVTNEVPQAEKYVKECGLRQEVIGVYWEDMENYAPLLMEHKKAPIHSIEVQIYKAALKAKADGYETLIFGESSDVNYGGLSGLMSKDWTIGEFIDRYSYVLPYHVLKEYEFVTTPYEEVVEDGMVDAHEFCRSFFLKEGINSYMNACACAGIEFESPYFHTTLACPLDLGRIRRGENKYIVRELYSELYPGWSMPEKTPMPRPMNEWMKDWGGPLRSEFWPHCTDHMSGDQKWMVWCLEKFLNMISNEGDKKQ